MSKLLSFVISGIGISVVSVATVQAMPFHTVHPGLTIHVGSGCGLGVHRGPFDGCNDYVYGGQYRSYYRGYYRGYNDGYYDGYYQGFGRSLIVDQGACSGRGMYRVCNDYGTCWAECN